MKVGSIVVVVLMIVGWLVSSYNSMVQRSGEPGYDNAEFWIRGVSTFAGGTSPLVLVDGVPRNMSDIVPYDRPSSCYEAVLLPRHLYRAERARQGIQAVHGEHPENREVVASRSQGCPD